MADTSDTIVNMKPFDVQEAVILLDVYLREKNNNLSRTEAAQIASQRLRALAVRRGMDVSDSFRSPTGLQNRLRSIAGLYEGTESVSAPGTEVFRQAVDLYKNDRQRFQRILWEAEDVPPHKSVQKSKKATGKIVHTKFEKDQPVQAEISSVDVQEDWIRFDFANAQSFERTSPAYCSIDNTEIEGKNWARILVAIVELELSNRNPALENLYKEPLYANRANRPFFVKEKIEGLHCAELSNGYWININWNIPRLMEIIQAFCLRCGYDKKQVVLYGIPKESASSEEAGSSEKKVIDRSFDMEKAEAYLRSAGLQGLAVQDLINFVQPHAAVSPVKNALDGNLNVIAMPEGHYVHVDSFVDLDEAEECIGKILRTHFSQFGGYSNSQLLFRAATQEISMFLNDNDCENIDAVYAIARFLFEKKAAAGEPYKFSSPHIFEQEPDYPMTLRGLMINLARNGGGVLNALDAKNYLQKTMLVYGSMGQLLQIGSSCTFLLYDSEQYILSEAIGIDDYWCCNMHDRLDDLFRKANVAYVIPRDISAAWLETLPPLPLGLSWTHLLLQEVLDKYPAIGFKSISPDLNQTHDTLSAAFVPIDSPLQSFPDVVTLFMEERHQLPMRMSGEELRQELRDAGMLEAGEMIYALPKALDDYRFAWTDENKTVLIRGNK